MPPRRSARAPRRGAPSASATTARTSKPVVKARSSRTAVFSGSAIATVRRLPSTAQTAARRRRARSRRRPWRGPRPSACTRGEVDRLEPGCSASASHVRLGARRVLRALGDQALLRSSPPSWLAANRRERLLGSVPRGPVPARSFREDLPAGVPGEPLALAHRRASRSRGSCAASSAVSLRDLAGRTRS